MRTGRGFKRRSCKRLISDDEYAYDLRAIYAFYEFLFCAEGVRGCSGLFVFSFFFEPSSCSGHDQAS